MDLDELLDTSAPSVTTHTRELRCELDSLAAACEQAHARRSRPVRIAIVGAAFAGVLGLGAVASAAGVLPGWPSFSTSSVQTCEIAIYADPLEPGDGEQPIAASFSAAEREQSLTAARRYLENFDYGSVDRLTAIAWWKSEEDAARAAQSDPAERQPRLTGDELEVTAVSHWVVDQLGAHLAAQGLDVRAINVWIGDTCRG
jgi:hypothetical protein